MATVTLSVDKMLFLMKKTEEERGIHEEGTNGAGNMEVHDAIQDKELRDGEIPALRPTSHLE